MTYPGKYKLGEKVLIGSEQFVVYGYCSAKKQYICHTLKPTYHIYNFDKFCKGAVNHCVDIPDYKWEKANNNAICIWEYEDGLSPVPYPGKYKLGQKVWCNDFGDIKIWLSSDYEFKFKIGQYVKHGGLLYFIADRDYNTTETYVLSGYGSELKSINVNDIQAREPFDDEYPQTAKFKLGQNVLFYGEKTKIIGYSKTENKYFIDLPSGYTWEEFKNSKTAVFPEYQITGNVGNTAATAVEECLVDAEGIYPQNAFKLGSSVWYGNKEHIVLGYNSKENCYIIKNDESQYLLKDQENIEFKDPSIPDDEKCSKVPAYTVSGKPSKFNKNDNVFYKNKNCIIKFAYSRNNIHLYDLYDEYNKFYYGIPESELLPEYPKSAKFQLGEDVWVFGKIGRVLGYNNDNGYLITSYDYNSSYKKFAEFNPKYKWLYASPDVMCKLIYSDNIQKHKPRFSVGDKILYNGVKYKISKVYTNGGEEVYNLLDKNGINVGNVSVNLITLVDANPYPDDALFQLEERVTYNNNEAVVLGYDAKAKKYIISSPESALLISYINWNRPDIFKTNNVNSNKKCIMVNECDLRKLNEETPEASDISDAAYRIAANQLINLFNKALVSVLKSQGALQSYGKAAAFLELMKGDLSNGLTSLALGHALTRLPQFQNNFRALRLAREFRVNGMMNVENEVLDAVAGIVAPLLSEAVESEQELVVLDNSVEMIRSS